MYLLPQSDCGITRLTITVQTMKILMRQMDASAAQKESLLVIGEA